MTIWYSGQQEEAIGQTPDLPPNWWMGWTPSMISTTPRQDLLFLRAWVQGDWRTINNMDRSYLCDRGIVPSKGAAVPDIDPARGFVPPIGLTGGLLTGPRPQPASELSEAPAPSPAPAPAPSGPRFPSDPRPVGRTVFTGLPGGVRAWLVSQDRCGVIHVALDVTSLRLILGTDHPAIADARIGSTDIMVMSPESGRAVVRARDGTVVGRDPSLVLAVRDGRTADMPAGLVDDAVSLVLDPKAGLGWVLAVDLPDRDGAGDGDGES